MSIYVFLLALCHQVVEGLHVDLPWLSEKHRSLLDVTIAITDNN